MIARIQNFSRKQKQLILLVVDLILILTCQWTSSALVVGDWSAQPIPYISWETLLFILIFFPTFIRSGMYRAVVQHAGNHFFFTIIKSVTISIGLTMLVASILLPNSITLVFWIVLCFFLLLTIGGSRLLARHFLYSFKQHISRIPVAIYGAGDAGIQLSMALKQSIEFKPVFFLDDDHNIQNTDIHGIRVHSPDNLKNLIEDYAIQRVLLAIPSVSRYRRREILQFLEKLPIHVQEIPSLVELASGTKQVDDVREVCVEDLLGRESIPPKISLMESCISDKSVLVTGAGGSIGSELCRQIIQLRPHRLVLVEQSEYFLYTIEGELRRLLEKQTESGEKIELIPILGSVLHRKRMQSVITTFAVQTVYHAAAYKHVPIIEYNPIEGIQNNIFGTLHMAQAAIDGGVETFILISTDKAVRPTNVMGATKRFAELILQGLAKSQKDICFSMVRFGNVLASSGSVIPLFHKQIKRGGPVTVTDPNVTRFFMTIPEATQLVIQAGAMARCGDVFILDMGSPVKILDLARRMIQLSGLTLRDANNPDGDVAIQFTGLRAGEKLYEELLIGDNTLPTDHPMIMRAMEESLPWQQVEEYLDKLSIYSKEFNYIELRNILIEAVKGYQPTTDIQDWVWISRANLSDPADP
ncbi:MAG: polysaccharide biosynthesis protein [Magnetococcales bacterium]|nr:polysaccharide biosynthesis protein [Magnetococcales bacterium]